MYSAVKGSIYNYEMKQEIDNLYSAGKGSIYNYDIKQEIDEPAVERCALMCQNANIRSKYAAKINQLTSHNLSF